MKITRIVLDVMSPAQQSMVDLAEKLNQIEGVSKVEIVLSELEKNVEDFKISIDGYGLKYETIRDVLRDFGAVIRNVDSITSSKLQSSNIDDDKISASMLVLARHIDSKIDKMTKIYSEFDETLEYIKNKR
ncbi:DUF211 domain-containing protein [Candidatus Bathyarchaeota archaeon]|nr:DUF211 domain-containing protein [Candidatus Bathyarchaeota archaeon]